jgi:hypothetical protein
MLSDAERKALLDLGTKFINSGEDVTLAHLLDLVNSTITDHGSPEWKEWSSYMEQLNIVWVGIHKENEDLPWPEVRKCSISVTKLRLAAYESVATGAECHVNNAKGNCWYC